MSFFNFMLRYGVSSEVVMQGMAKNDPTEKKNGYRNSGEIEACASMKTHRR